MGYCTWADINEANRIYHDTEWGIPVHDDRHMFEHLSLECLQCGLSWDLMLKKREIFRRCFDNFDYERIAAYDDADVERILNTEGMIRSRRKVEAVINNAKKRGFKFVGAVTIYSHLQACGIINDHDRDCPCYRRINEAHPTVRKRRDHEVK